MRGPLLVQGFVISDWEGIDKICEPRVAQGSDYRYCIKQSVNAGMDMVYMVAECSHKYILQMMLVLIAWTEQSTDYDTLQL